MFNSKNPEQFLDLFKPKLPFIFQAKDDGHGKKDEETTKKYGKVWHRTGVISEVGPWLNKHNKDQWGCFFTVNELDQSRDPKHKRTEEMLVRIRAIWCEDDEKRDEPRTEWPIEPNVVVNSSPGKYHYYWITSAKATEHKIDEWRGIMQTMVDQYGCDNNAKDLVRVMRLPGFFHMKNPDSPHLVTYQINRKTAYLWKEILDAFPQSDYKPIQSSEDSDHIENSETLTKTMEELIDDYANGHRHGPSSRTAMKLVNYNIPKDEVISILKGLFPEVNIDQHIQSTTSAIKKKESEAVREFHTTETGNIRKDPPHFDTSFVHAWPDPWPMIFSSFEGAIYQVIEEIYVPACFAFHSVMLNSVFRTVRNRGPNLNMQIISASGVGKDSNTSEPIERIVSRLRKEWGSGISDSDKYGLKLMSPIFESVTADTTYLKTLQFEENQAGGLILNTEASGHWDMVASADNPHTEGVMRIEINMWDGHNISGKVVGKNRFEDIHNPNYTCLRLQQTEALERNLTQRMIDIGLGNRVDYYADNIDRPEVASTELSGKNVGINDDYMEFLQFLFKFVFINANNQIKVITSQPGGIIHRFETEVLLPLVNNGSVTRDEFKFLKRIIGSAEKQVTEITAFVYIWRLFKGIDTSDMVITKIGDIVLELNGAAFESYVLPMMEYQLKMRRHLFEHVLSTSQATAETDAINEVWERCVQKVSTEYKPWHNIGGIVAAHFHARVKAHKFFSKNNKYNNPETITRAVNSWVNVNGLEMKKLEVNGKKKTCYVM